VGVFYAINGMRHHEMRLPSTERRPVRPIGKSDADRYCATLVKIFAEDFHHPKACRHQ
jgi:hypothetical protein